jgi:phosphodiesterase/alkaline phosphatase D-like protein
MAKTVAANGVSRTSANLNGEVTPNRATTQYWFEYGKTSDLGQISGFTSVGDGTAKVLASVALANLDPLTTYYFRLNAQNQFGTVNGGILNFRTAGPSAATAPSVTTRPANDVERTTAVLRGTVDANSAETKYWFEYSTDSLLGSVLLKATAQKSAGAGTNDLSVSADVSGLAADTNYYFRLVAQNSLGTDRGDRETFKTKK